MDVVNFEALRNAFAAKALSILRLPPVRVVGSEFCVDPELVRLDVVRIWGLWNDRRYRVLHTQEKVDAIVAAFRQLRYQRPRQVRQLLEKAGRRKEKDAVCA